MDKNQATGLILLSAVLIVYLMFFAPEPPPPPVEVAADSVAMQTEKAKPALAQEEPAPAEVFSDSVLSQRFGVFGAAMRGESQEVVLENELMKVTFDTKGGTVKRVNLKKFVTNEKKELILFDENTAFKKEEINTIYGYIDLNKLYYRPQVEGNKITFSLLGADGLTLMQRSYTLKDGTYELLCNAYVQPIENYLRDREVSFYWFDKIKLVELDVEQSRQRSTINYYLADETFDYLSETSKEPETASLNSPAKWVSIKQKFFNAAVLSDAGLNNLSVATAIDEADPETVKLAEVKLNYSIDQLTEGSEANFRYYFGPNDYGICKTVAPEFERNVYLGWFVFAEINKWVIGPLFALLEKVTTNYGIIILILVFIVRMFMFPLTYKSYVSMAKMKVLKPEMDEINERVGNDMAKKQQETMKLYQQVGVNPLSGCIPVFAQFPIFLALFNFFPNAIQLRQESFLWATDLSSYDSILDLSFTIPFYGDHVSLFTLLMVVSQLGYTYLNNQNTPSTSPQAQQMKVFGYIMPVMFMFFLNSFSSGLTYYYFVSNLITIGQTLAIRQIIDDEKIRTILERNKEKNKGKKKSGLAARLEQAMKAQEEKAKQAQQAKKKK